MFAGKLLLASHLKVKAVEKLVKELNQHLIG
jgi:hypothetical protein